MRVLCLLLLATVGLLAGCGRPKPLMPLAVGKKWTYRFRHGVQTEIAEVKVLREVPMLSTVGYELGGPMGSFNVVERNGQLLTTRMAGASFERALPFGLPAGQVTYWQSWVVGLKGRQPARAEIISRLDPPEGKGPKRVLTTVVMVIAGKKVTLLTWFDPGKGIVEQQQLRDDTVELAIDRIAG